MSEKKNREKTPYTGKLVEGKSYIFNVLEIVEKEGEDFFVLESEFNEKHLLHTTFYTSELGYSIEIGAELKCFVDKIDSDAKVFLEPEHGTYKRNSINRFPFVRFDKGLNDRDQAVDVIIVEDIYGRECSIYPEVWQMDSDIDFDLICCKIERVSKTKLQLLNMSSNI